jgi:TatD DNase family protein
MSWIDSHCHITHEKIAVLGTPDALIGRAAAAGVSGMLVINCRIVEELPVLLDAVNGQPDAWCTIGTHPHEASRADEKSVTVKGLLERIAAHEKIVGIGESGLDYFYDLSDRDDQQASFRKHIQAALASGLPLVVHARDADADIIRLIREETGGKGMAGIMHCFSSSPKMAYDALDLGFHISFSGMITFRKSEELRQIAKNIPLNRLLVETDAPYLAPEPHRGRTNEPAFVVHTGARLAEIHAIAPDEMARITRENFFELFKRCRPN